MKKLIAIDLDGTLLTPDGKISEENLSAIFKAQDQGHIVMICSGRSAEDISKIIHTAGIVCPIAGSNGAVVEMDGRILQRISMDREDVSAISEMVAPDNIFYEFYTSHGIYVPADWKERIDKLVVAGGFPNEIGTAFKNHIGKLYREGCVQFFEDETEMWSKDNVTVQKINMLLKDPARRASLLSFLEQFSGIAITAPESFNLEVMHKDGHKGNGLKCVADFYGIPLEHTIAIGNSYNDMAMFETAGLSVAMGNAEQAIKDRCHVVTLSNSENGVAYALDKYVLTK